MTSSYPPSTVAYPLLFQLLNSMLPVPVFSTSSTFTWLSSSVSSATTTTSTSTLLPISSLMSTDVQISPPPFRRFFPPSFRPLQTQHFLLCRKMLSPRLHTWNYILPSVTSCFATHDLQQRKPRHPKRPQLLPGEAGTPVRRIVHTAVYKQKLHQYNKTLKLYENYIANS